MSSEPDDLTTPETDDPQQAPTGLGSGGGSGLGHSLTSEPEPLLGDDRPDDGTRDEQA